MIERILILLVLTCSGMEPVRAQFLELREVVEQVLQYNFDVRLAGVDTQIAAKQATMGNAGLLPGLQLNAGSNYSNNNTELRFAGSIPPVNVDGAVNTSINGSLALNYTLFSGFANLRTYEQLQLNEDMTGEQLKLTLENAILNTITVYLDLKRLYRERENMRQHLTLSKLRLEQLERSRALGLATSYDLMVAKVDLNQDSIDLLTLENQIGGMKRQVNVWMGRKPTAPLDTDTSDYPLPVIELTEVLEKALNSSSALALAEMRSRNLELGEGIARSSMLPRITLNSSYGFSNSSNAAGIILEQNNLGLSGGLSVSLPIYSGGKIRSAVENTRLAIEKNEISRQQLSMQVEKEVYDHWFNFQNYQTMSKLERTHVQTAEVRMKMAEERSRLGQINSLDYREAQLALLAARSRLYAANCRAMQAVFQLMRYEGTLLNP